jgi:hypothetical protein
MCGCNKGKSKVGGKTCQGRISTLQNLRNRIVTLENVTSSEEQKEIYRTYRGDIEALIGSSINTCPDATTISLLKQYVDNEYAKNN